MIHFSYCNSSQATQSSLHDPAPLVQLTLSKSDVQTAVTHVNWLFYVVGNAKRFCFLFQAPLMLNLMSLFGSTGGIWILVFFRITELVFMVTELRQ